MAVLHPLESRMHQTKARAKRILCVVWIIPCCVASPFLYPAEAFSNTLQSSYGMITRLTCFISLPEKVRKGYYTFLFVFIYILPLTFIAGTCLQVARCLLKDIPVHRQGSIRRQETNRRKVAKMVMMVVLTFAIAWTPYFLVSIVTQYQAENFMERQNFFFTMLCINLFAFLNSCVNPFIYAAMSTRFRNGFLRCFRFVCMWGLCTTDEAEEEIAAPTNTGRGTKTVRFRCKAPMSCLLTQSSSDGGSNAQSDTSMRTAYTVDANGRQINSIMKVFGKKHASQNSKPIIAHYIKKTGDIKMIGNGIQLNSRWNNFKQDSPMPECPPLLRSMRLSISAGDMRTMDIPKTRKTPLSMKKCFSCLTISSSAKEMPEFW